ncbi:hypothetical protein TNCV_851671 [Trichonephila clavipes]|nr:hypothetical protein TNCV_851671 [Trichonephila clavipes]
MSLTTIPDRQFCFGQVVGSSPDANKVPSRIEVYVQGLRYRRINDTGPPCCRNPNIENHIKTEPPFYANRELKMKKKTGKRGHKMRYPPRNAILQPLCLHRRFKQKPNGSNKASRCIMHSGVTNAAKKNWAAFLPKSSSQQEATSRNLLLENGISPNDRPDHAYPPKDFHPPKQYLHPLLPPHPLTSLKTPNDELSRDFLLVLMEPPLRE